MTAHRPEFRLRRRDPGVRVELTPLIDVVFLLLTFFIFSIVLLVRVDALDVRLPELTGAADAPTGRLVTVAITRDGAISVNAEPVDLQGLPDAARAALDSADASDPDVQPPRLVLAVDAEAPAERLIAVGGALARAGLGGFSLVGIPAESPGPAPAPAPAPAPLASEPANNPTP